jgi:hypothetical protein
VWDPDSNTINCDDDSDEAADDITDCQADADNDIDGSKEEIECEADPDTCSLTKRSLSGRANKKCMKQPETWDDPNAAESALGCVGTFLCDTDKWPNVCLNAKSAQDLRGKPSALTYWGERERYGRDVTKDWYVTHAKLGLAVSTEFHFLYHCILFSLPRYWYEADN